MVGYDLGGVAVFAGALDYFSFGWQRPPDSMCITFDLIVSLP
jgi:hypothetical protein